VSDHGLAEGSLLRLEIRPPRHAPHPSQKGYESFLAQVQFQDVVGRAASVGPAGSVYMSTSPTAVVLQLKPDQFGSRVDLQSLVELQSLEREGVDSMQQTFGYEEAKNRGFVQWTSSHLVYERVMLLEISARREALEGRRYCFSSVNQLYAGGDRHSWQRYTKHLPLPCVIRVHAATHQISLTPRTPLKPAQEYAVLLMHGGKVLASAEHVTGDGDGVGVSELAVLSDHLVFFTTAASPLAPLPGGKHTKDDQTAEIEVAGAIPHTHVPRQVEARSPSHASSGFERVSRVGCVYFPFSKLYCMLVLGL
jgi:hypothetical protein